MCWVEDVEISIFDPTTIEIGGGVGFHQKRGGVLGFTFASSPNQVGFFLSGAKTDILGDLWLVLFIRENKGVMTRVASVKESPSFSRMGGVLKFCT